MRLAVLAGLAAAVTFAADPAFAQVKHRQITDDGDLQVFDDDPLSSGVMAPYGDGIRVRPVGQRATLIRPRVQFVTEMLKSIEII